MTWVKICGMTSEQDLAAAAALGADAVGVVLAPSKRRLSASQAARLAATAPASVTLVAVVTEVTPEVVAAVRGAGIGLVQLHGPRDPDPGELRLLAGLRLVRAVAVRVPADLERPEPDWLWAWLLDSAPVEHAGGSGRAFAWPLAREAIRRWRRPVIVAGGLNASNVTAAIAELHPWGVDVSTGVEQAPGRKDPAAMAAFIQAVRQADMGERR